MNFYYIDTLVKVEVALVDYTAFPHEAAAGGVDLGLGLFGFDFKYTGLAPYLHAVGLCLVDARCVGKFGSYYRSHLHYKRIVAYGYTVDPCVSQSVTFVGQGGDGHSRVLGHLVARVHHLVVGVAQFQ